MGRIDEFEEWQLTTAYGLGFLALERRASKFTVARYGMPVWKIYAISASTSLVTMSAMDMFLQKYGTETQHQAFRKFHSHVFNLPEPMGFFPNPFGLVAAVFESGEMIGEAFNPIEVARGPTMRPEYLIPKFLESDFYKHIRGRD